MQPGALIHLSRRVKITLLCTLLLGVISSLCLVAYGLAQGAEGEMYFSSGVSMLQFAVTGFALTLVALFSTKTVGTDELMKQTTLFLTKEMPRAFKGAILVGSLDESTWSTEKVIGDESQVEVKVDHVKGSPSATYSVRWRGSTIKMRITLNAFRFVVLYYVPKTDDMSQSQVSEAIEMVTSGAETVGYSSKLATNLEIDGTEQFVEIYFFKTVDRDLLLDTSARLFWSQDIAVMTKSMLIQLGRHGLISASAVGDRSGRSAALK